MQRLLTGTGLILVVMVSAWWVYTNWGYDYYVTRGPCGTERVQSAAAAVEQVFEKLSRLERIQVSGQSWQNYLKEMVRRMQGLREEARLIDAPLCMRGVKEHMLIGLESLIADWVLAQKAPVQYRGHPGFDGAVMNFYMAEQELIEIEQCVPFCESIMFNQILP